jgi:CheY-like chemotaxis protein
MTDFSGFRVLVVEDELLIALALEDILSALDFDVRGPFARVDEALALARAEQFDGALLDVNIRGELVYPVADELLSRGVPVIFCSGYSDSTIMPARFRSVPQIAKPYDDESLLRAMNHAFHPRRQGPVQQSQAAAG